MFLFTSHDPHTIVAASTPGAQAMLAQSSAVSVASTFPDPDISSAVAAITGHPLDHFIRAENAFLHSSAVDGDLYIGITVLRAHVYRYEGDCLSKVIVATFIMVLALAVYVLRRYWVPCFLSRVKKGFMAISSKDEEAAESLERRLGKADDPNAPHLSIPLLVAFVGFILVVNTFIVVYRLEGVIRTKEKLRLRHITEVSAELIDDVARGAIRTLDYASFMTQQGYVPPAVTPEDTITLETFVVSATEDAHNAHGVGLLEFGFSGGRVEGSVYYSADGNDGTIAVISNGALAGNDFTIFEPEAIGVDTSTANYIFKDPTYELFNRSWYQAAHGEDGLVYNEPFLTLSSKQYAISWGRETVVPTGERSYVIQSGILLSQLSLHLQQITRAKRKGLGEDAIFVMSKSNTLLASSSGDTQQEVCEVAETINPGQSLSGGVNRTYAALKIRFGNPHIWPGDFGPFLTGGDSTQGPLLISIKKIKGIGGSVMDWSLVVSSPHYTYHEGSRGVQVVIILITGIIILLTSAIVQLTEMKALRKALDLRRPVPKVHTQHGNEDALMKDFIRQQLEVHKAMKKRCNPDFEGLRHPLNYIKLPVKKVELWTFLRLEQRSEWKRKLFYMQRSKIWTRFIFLVLFCHCALAFWEAPTRTYITNTDLNLSYQAKLFAVRAFCLIALWTDTLAEALYEGLYIELLVKDQEREDLRFWLKKSLNIRLVLIILILTFMIFDYVAGITTLYTTKALSQRLFFFLPVSAVFRPILVILRVPEVLGSGKRALFTAYRSLPTLAMLLVILLVIAITNVLLFTGEIKNTGLLQGRTFDDFMSSLIQTTLFVLTQANQNVIGSVVDCPLGPSGFYSNGCPKAASYLYFAFISFIGFIVFMAVLVMAFQIQYFKLVRAEAAKARGMDRLAYIAAFLQIEKEDGKVTGFELRGLLKRLEGEVGYPIYFNLQGYDAVDLEEFVELMEQFHPYLEGKNASKCNVRAHFPYTAL